MARRYVPKRGDVVWLQFSPQLGHEQSGRRPALTVSPKSYNQKVGLGLFCPITSHVKGYPFEVRLAAGLPVHGAVLADQVKSLDWRERKAKRLCTVPNEVVEEVIVKISLLVTPETS